MDKKTLARFWAKVDKRGPDECWEWKASRNRKGYGIGTLRGITERYAHRLSWIIHSQGGVPAGFQILHSCDNPPCVNPAHLRVGTHADNMRDRNSRGRTARHIGDLNPNATLTQAQADELRARFAAGGITARTLASEHGITSHHAWRVLHGGSWQASNPAHLVPTRPTRRFADNGNAKLTWEKVRAIREDAKEPGITQQQIALRYGLSQVHIGKIIHRKCWESDE